MQRPRIFNGARPVDDASVSSSPSCYWKFNVSMRYPAREDTMDSLMEFCDDIDGKSMSRIWIVPIYTYAYTGTTYDTKEQNIVRGSILDSWL